MKGLNLNTIKVHNLGDVPFYVLWARSTESYGTGRMETQHRWGKTQYRRTNKKDFIIQIIRIDRWQRRVRAIQHAHQQIPEFKSHLATDDSTQYHIGKTENHPINMPDFYLRHALDPATKGFSRKLYKHLLERIQVIHSNERDRAARQFRASLSPTNCPPPKTTDVTIKRNWLYQHATMMVHYTAYDVRRDQDVLGPDMPQHNVMLLASAANNEDRSPWLAPYCYAHVLRIYHANIIYTYPDTLDYGSRRVDFLWVRWYEQEAFTASNAWPRKALIPAFQR
ncbi:hypothetical protein OF83DRAFT_1178618 [Amylostereum chailletii]|nr:hypothetical protein OF83DRAFT_1178618 [Amylostereum chailletii]